MSTLWYGLVVFCMLCSPAPCWADSQTNDTSLWIVVNGWAPEPNSTRGTMDIIWTCLATIFACSWTVTHPSFQGFSWEKSKLSCCFIAVVAPEVLALMAVDEYIAVRKGTIAVKELSKGPWTLSQTFFAYMGGVHLEFKDCTEALGLSVGGEFNEDFALPDLQRAVQLDILSLDSISAEDVELRAKTNHIVKFLVCLQASWLVAQVIGRAVAKLPITTLEAVTVGYVVCALITYSCWWHKPQDAEVPIKVDCRRLTKEEFYRQINDVRIGGKEYSWRELAVQVIIAGSFGAVHCTAWNFVFATFAESLIWKVASILTAFSAMVIFGMLGASYNPFSSWLGQEFLCWVFTLLYAIVRLYLMVEPFVAFRSVPVGIFHTVNWASWIPHI